MRRDHSETQQCLPGFETPFQTHLDPDNRWVKLATCIPWDHFGNNYYQQMSCLGRPEKSARLVIGAVIIKHKLCLSDRETVAQIQENPYLQYFVGLNSFQTEQVFAPSLFVDIRKRMGEQLFEQFQQSIVDTLSKKDKAHNPVAQSSSPDNELRGNGSVTHDTDADTKNDDPNDDSAAEPVTHQGKLIVDATVAEQAIRYPTDLSLLNEAREISEQLIDCLYPHSTLTKKPRTYRNNARRDFLSLVKQRRPTGKRLRRGLKQQRQYLRRNLKHIEALLDSMPGQAIPLSHRSLRYYWIIQHLYAQQEAMYREKVKRCAHRIVSLHQPHVRPIVRGKANKSVEFGAKLNVSLDKDGLAHVEELSWEAYHEGNALPDLVEAYTHRYGYYPEVVLADPLYGTRDNRRFLKKKAIRYGGKPLGRPKKITAENRAQLQAEKRQRQKDYRQRIPIEGKFGQGKNGYRLNYIRARLADTSGAWIRSIFLVMNLLVLYEIFIWLRKSVWWSRFSSACIVNLLLKRLMPFKEERAVELGYSLREGIFAV
ncbi:MAG: IS5 family transposase [Pseudomonadales bacterium]